jgi:septum formation protein
LHETSIPFKRREICSKKVKWRPAEEPTPSLSLRAAGHFSNNQGWRFLKKYLYISARFKPSSAVVWIVKHFTFLNGLPALRVEDSCSIKPGATGAGDQTVMNQYSPICRESPLILASESPRRKRLLEQVGIPFMSLPSNINETSVNGSPSHLAKILAERKAMAALGKVQRQWILGADTIVVSGDDILGKPSNGDEARSMLSILNGKEHEVITGYSIIDPSGEIACTGHENTTVSVKTLSAVEIDSYIATGEPFGKAGGYAIQGIGSFMVERISGSYSNVVGLPLCSLIKRLLEIGALKEFPY